MTALRPSVSVVIPTCRRATLLGRCLAALLSQDLPAHAFEILVCDDGPCEDTRALVATLAARHAAGGAPAIRRVVPARGHGPAAARNAGWQAARAAVIAFTDDDTVPAPDWLRQGLDALLPDLAAVCGRVTVPLPPRCTDHARNTARLADAEFVTANCFVRADALALVGGFDPRFTRAWREDSDLQFALLEHGARIGRAPLACVAHPVRPVPWGVSVRQQANMAFDALLYKKHPRLYRERIQRGPPLRYYLAVGSAALALSAAALGERDVAAAGLLGWAATTAWLTVQRMRGVDRDAALVAEVALTSIVIPFAAVFWRLAGALRWRVTFA